MQKKIRLGITDLSFHRVTGSLITQVLISMGFEVERIYSHHEENFKKLNTNAIDLLTSAWLPSSHGLYKEEVERSVPLLELGLHYKPYALWGVPDYIPMDEVRQVADLLKPTIVQKMRSHIQGINPGAGITRFSIKMMEAYGLAEAGYTFSPGTEETCFTTFENAYAKEEWIVVPLWKPQFLHHRYTIRELIEPKKLLGSVDRAVLLMREDKANLFSATELQRLDSLRFSNEIIAQLDYAVSRENKPIDEVTNYWLANKALHDKFTLLPEIR